METNSSANPPSAEGCGQPVAPQKEHAWLKTLVGQWTTQAECMGPDGQTMKDQPRGTEVVKMLGDLWVIGEGEGSMPGGGRFSMRVTLGFDPLRNRFVGTWIGSMMTSLWVYEGELDASEKILTLNAEGPSFTDPAKTAKYQDIIELKNDRERTLTSRCLGDDGAWVQFMTVTYRRS